MTTTAIRHPLFPNVRRSPYFADTAAAGAIAFMVYNHMYMPISYGRDPREEYEALTTGVTLWDVGAERQTAITGPDARRLADYLATRDLSELALGACRFTLICDDAGQIMTEPIVLHPFEDMFWISHGDVDLTLWARATAIHGRFDVTVDEPDVAPDLEDELAVEVLPVVGVLPTKGVGQLEWILLGNSKVVRNGASGLPQSELKRLRVLRFPLPDVLAG